MCRSNTSSIVHAGSPDMMFYLNRACSRKLSVLFFEVYIVIHKKTHIVHTLQYTHYSTHTTVYSKEYRGLHIPTQRTITTTLGEGIIIHKVEPFTSTCGWLMIN